MCVFRGLPKEAPLLKWLARSANTRCGFVGLGLPQREALALGGITLILPRMLWMLGSKRRQPRSRSLVPKSRREMWNMPMISHLSRARSPTVLSWMRSADGKRRCLSPPRSNPSCLRLSTSLFVCTETLRTLGTRAGGVTVDSCLFGILRGSHESAPDA